MAIIETLNYFMPLFTAIIAFSATIGTLSLAFKLFLKAIEKDISHIKQDLGHHITDINKKILRNHSFWSVKSSWTFKLF